MKNYTQSKSLSQRESAVEYAVVAQRGGHHVNARARPIRDLPAQLGAQRLEQAVAGFGDAAADHNAGGIQQHDAGFQAQREIHHVAAYKSGILDQLLRGLAVIARQPEAAAHALEAAAPAAQALRTVGPDGEMADLAAVRIRATPDAPVFVDTAADAGGKRHIEQR